MTHYEYKVVPAPKRGERVRGVKASEDRFAIALCSVMNAQAAEGWEYQRTETLPSEEREGLMGKATVFQNMMVFRKIKAVVAAPVAPPPAQLEDKRRSVEGVDATSAEQSHADTTVSKAPPAQPEPIATPADEGAMDPKKP